MEILALFILIEMVPAHFTENMEVVVLPARLWAVMAELRHSRRIGIIV